MTINGGREHHLTVTQDGPNVLVTDTDTGVTSRIDPVGLAAAEQRGFGTGTTVVAGADQAYVIDAHVAQRVQRIDPKTLDPLGAPLSFGSAIGGAGLTADGTLWVALPEKGQLVPVRHGTAGTAVTVARPGYRLSLIIVDGLPVAVDATTPALVPVRDGRPAPALRLPDPAGQGRQLLVAPSVDGHLAPVIVDGTTTMLLADPGAGAVRAVDLGSQDPSGKLGAPVVAGNRVYIPDNDKGRLLVYAADLGQFSSPITVTPEPAKLTVFVKDGMLWANDERGSHAVLVRPDGSAQPIEKHAPDVAGSAATTPPRPLPTQTITPPHEAPRSQPSTAAPPQPLPAHVILAPRQAPRSQPSTAVPPQVPTPVVGPAPSPSRTAPPAGGQPTPAAPPAASPSPAPVQPSASSPPPTPVQPPASSPPPPPAPTTYREQTGSTGSPTFSNPHNASGQGPRIAVGAYVEVQCRVRAPEIRSANPDGWWYRIASSPWNGQYYGVANNFRNGDVPGQGPPYHNTDFNVPPC